MSQRWQPTATLEILKERARILQSIRAFFALRNVLEVETPVISKAAVTEPQVESFSTQFHQKEFYLHTSPEFYMKRLLAAGSGDIFQIAKVFRDDENGRNHNPEFSMLEWYRLGFNHHQLMDEMELLLSGLMIEEKVNFQRLSYQQAFINQLEIDPFNADVLQLKKVAERYNIETPQGMDDDRDMWLDWLMVEKISADFPKNSFTFLYDYPASQASLARLDKDDSRKANRFELFYGELELANGYYELTDADEQVKRFENDNIIRQQRGQKLMPVDECLLAALKSGLPECSGVAMGIDRLLMLIMGVDHINEVISFGDEF
ncbi:MAG: EF-P lysine aminoacylase EpmA [Gammaproteobacteria bacterium]|nr:EF-P lysine aminoacylase EpmA [Gammaproteobacteria bacterium]